MVENGPANDEEEEEVENPGSAGIDLFQHTRVDVGDMPKSKSTPLTRRPS